MIKTIEKALWSFYPETPNWYDWAKADPEGNKIPNYERMQTKYVIVNSVHKGIVTRPTDKEINDKIAELEDEHKKQSYARSRADAYPSWQTQMDLLYHGGLDALKAELKKTKDKFPKPE
mgnify:CR=1 FL=1|tara:strand:+ start:405 stop:761 length:357 start_codon:yes stop_codon:yes gene_type:complete